MQIAFVIYRGFTVLDVIGPFQTLGDVPGHEACNATLRATAALSC